MAQNNPSAGRSAAQQAAQATLAQQTARDMKAAADAMARAAQAASDAAKAQGASAQQQQQAAEAAARTALAHSGMYGQAIPPEMLAHAAQQAAAQAALRPPSLAATALPYAQAAAGQLGFQIPTDALSAFTAAIRTTITALKSMEAGITAFGYDSGRAFDDFLKKTGALELPGAKDMSRNDWGDALSWLYGGASEEGKKRRREGSTETDRTSYRDRERQLADAEENLGRGTAEARLTAIKDTQIRDYQRQAAEQQSRLMFGSNDNALMVGAKTFYTAQREAAQAKAGGTFGYGRPEEQADIARRTGFAETLFVQQGSAARVMAGLTRQQDLDKGVTSGIEKQVAAQRAEVDRATAGVDKFKDPRGPGTIDAEATYKARENLEAEQTKLLSLEQQLIEAHKQGAQDYKSIVDQINETGKQRIQTLEQMRDAESSVMQQEKQRNQTRQEDFGLMLPGEKAAALQVARDLAGGKQLNRMEWEFARSHGELFGDAMNRRGAAMAGPEFDEISKLMGFEARGKAAEQVRAQLDAQIKVDVAGIDKDVATKITEGIMPEIKKVIDDVATKFTDELNKVFNQIARARLGAGQ